MHIHYLQRSLDRIAGRVVATMAGVAGDAGVIGWLGFIGCIAVLPNILVNQAHAKDSQRPIEQAERVAAAQPDCHLRPRKRSITVRESNTTLANLKIETDDGAALTIDGAHDVLIENLHIRHRRGRGIDIRNSSRVRIVNVVVESVDAPPSGAHKSPDNENIAAYRSDHLRIDGARLYRGSAGVYLIESDNAHLSNIYGEDFRGPYPRGQFVQFNRSHRGLLTDFYTLSLNRSWPEDNVNIYQSDQALIQRGVIDGNNSPTGVGVIFDGGTSSGKVIDVDAVRMGNGSFSAYDGSANVAFIRTRSRDHICSDQGRGLPSSGGTIWTAHPRLAGIRIVDSAYFNPCFQTLWPKSAFRRPQLRQTNFKLRPLVKPGMCWESI